MALIYSSAVNKRINNAQRSGKRSTVESPHQSIQEVYHCTFRSHDETVKSQQNDGFNPMSRSISLGKEISCNRKRSVTQSKDQLNGCVPSGSGNSVLRKESTPTYCNSKSNQAKERLLRSKTSIGEMKRKNTVGGDVRNSRKISTPVMSQSVIPNRESCIKAQKMDQELRKALTKKCCIQNQEAFDDDEQSSSHSGSPENFEKGAYLIRLKSNSLNEDDWKRRVEGAQMLGLRTEPETKVGALQRMRNKLCKLKLAIADSR